MPEAHLRTLVVNDATDLTERDIRQLFHPEFDETIEAVRVVPADKDRKRSAFVEFTDNEAAEKALELKGDLIFQLDEDRRQLALSWAQPVNSYVAPAPFLPDAELNGVVPEPRSRCHRVTRHPERQHHDRHRGGHPNPDWPSDLQHAPGEQPSGRRRRRIPMDENLSITLDGPTRRKVLVDKPSPRSDQGQPSSSRDGAPPPPREGPGVSNGLTNGRPALNWHSAPRPATHGNALMVDEPPPPYSRLPPDRNDRRPSAPSYDRPGHRKGPLPYEQWKRERPDRRMPQNAFNHDDDFRKRARPTWHDRDAPHDVPKRVRVDEDATGDVRFIGHGRQSRAPVPAPTPAAAPYPRNWRAAVPPSARPPMPRGGPRPVPRSAPQPPARPAAPRRPAVKPSPAVWEKPSRDRKMGWLQHDDRFNCEPVTIAISDDEDEKTPKACECREEEGENDTEEEQEEEEEDEEGSTYSDSVSRCSTCGETLSSSSFSGSSRSGSTMSQSRSGSSASSSHSSSQSQSDALDADLPADRTLHRRRVRTPPPPANFKPKTTGRRPRR